jgi:hypothetical protein
MTQIPYSDKDIQNFNNLLTIIMSNVETTEQNVRKLIPDEKEFKLAHIINEHYPSFKIDNGFYLLTKEGVEIQSIGLKQHILKVRTEQQLDIKIKELTLRELSKSDERNKQTNRLSKIAIITSCILPILIFWLDKSFVDDVSYTLKDSNGNSEITIKVTPPNIISDTLNSSDKKIIFNKIIHNSDTLNSK